MIINTIKRPWERQGRYGTRTTRDPRYQGRAWARTKEEFKQGFTVMPDGHQLPNTCCYQCYLETGKHLTGYAIDHNTRVKDGADFHDKKNLRNLCESHHNSKSAREGNEERKATT